MTPDEGAGEHPVAAYPHFQGGVLACRACFIAMKERAERAEALVSKAVPIVVEHDRYDALATARAIHREWLEEARRVLEKEGK